MRRVAFIVIFLFALVGLVACEVIELPPAENTIVFDTQGGSEISSIEFDGPVLITAPAFPSKEGYYFDGWYTDLEYTNQWSFENDYVTRGMKLYAKWKEVTTDFNESFKVLSIGNSFSEDAHRYLWSIAESYGINSENIIVANMYIGGSELKNHIDNLNSNNGVYSYQKYTSPNMAATGSYKLSDAIVDEDWDLITFQQASHFSGVTAEYKNYLETLTNWAKAEATNPEVLIGWHMTWAYDSSSNHSGFANYDNNQATMLNMIIETMYNKVFANGNFNLVIPSGIAVQNARTSYVGDKLTRDGYHLTDPLGRYIAALAYFKALTKFDISPETITYAPERLIEEDILVAFESVNNAFDNPLVVTDSVHTEEPEREEPETPIDAGMPVTFTYELGFWNNNATAVSPETDGLHNRFVAVHPISVKALPVGSNIVLEEGYQFRFIRFKMEGEVLKVIGRTNNYTESIVVDSELLADAEFVAFNIAPAGNAVDISGDVDEVASKLTLFSPSGSHLVLNENGELIFNYMMGFWNNNATDISPETDALHNKFVTTHPIPKEQMGVGTVIKLEAGYQYRFIRLEKTETGFIVTSRTSNLFTNAELVVDAQLITGGDYFSFNLQQIGGPVIDDIDEVASKLTIIPAEYEEVVIPDVDHIDAPLYFTSGYWNNGGTAIQDDNNAFSKTFAASNVFSKESDELKDAVEIVVGSGYQIRIIFLSYDGKGNYLVRGRSTQLTGTIDLTEPIASQNSGETIDYAAYDYIAFTIFKVKAPSQSNEDVDVSGMLVELEDELTFVELVIEHVDVALNFTSGYWNNNATAITPGTDAFTKTFAASNVFSKESDELKDVLEIVVEAGYQIRIVFMEYDNKGTYTVKARSANLQGTIDLTELVASQNSGQTIDYAAYDFIAFNISKVKDPSNQPNEEVDVSGMLEELKTKLIFN